VCLTIFRSDIVTVDFFVAHLNVLGRIPSRLRRCNSVTTKQEAALPETPTRQATWAPALIQVVGVRTANLPDPKAKDALDPYVRERASRVPMIPPSRSPVLSERAWIEANGY
jgi:hypothetical protein